MSASFPSVRNLQELTQEGDRRYGSLKNAGDKCSECGHGKSQHKRETNGDGDYCVGGGSTGCDCGNFK